MAHREKKPKYVDIQERLTREIREGRYAAHDLFYTIDDLCVRFETSRITAQRALMEMVRSGVIYTKRGCGAFIAPERPVEEGSRLIAFLMDADDSSNEGALPLVMRGAEMIAREHDYHLLCCHTQADARLTEQYIDRLLEQRVAGVLYDFVNDMASDQRIHHVVQRFEMQGVPVVFVQKRLLNETEQNAYVITDNYGGTFRSVEYLAELGHRAIAGIFELSNSGAIERCEGYRGAVLKTGAIFRPDYIKIMESLADCRPAVDQLLSIDRPPTAIVCAHDLVAREVLNHLEERGLNVPRDVSIVGFDDLPFSKYLRPALTTVRQPLEEIGRRAMDLLVQRISGDFRQRLQLRLDTELVIRESSAAPLPDAHAEAEAMPTDAANQLAEAAPPQAQADRSLA